MKKFLLLGIFAFIFTLFTIPSNIKALAETTDDLPEELLKLNYQQTLLANKVDTYLKKYYNNLYPTYFGGIYISDDSKNVIIQIVKSNIPDKDTEEYSIYDEILNIDSALKIEYVNNSYEELNGLNNEINDIFSDSKTKYENLSANGIDIINNKVKIVLRNNNEEEQSKFLNTINNSNLRSYANILEKFVFSEGTYSQSATDLYPGESRINCSVGFRVKYNGKPGFMTAGHCVEKGANYIVGTAVVKQMADNEKYDYAFIQTNSNYTPTITLYHKASNVTKLAVVDYCPSIYVGTIISRSGAVSKYSSGQIQAINVTADYKANGIRIQGLVETNLTSRPGDSGAPVFIPKKDSEGGGIAVGIVSGGGEGIMYFTSINNLPAALQNRY